MCQKAFLLCENRIAYLIKGGGLIDAFYGHVPRENGVESQAWIASTVRLGIGKGQQGLSRLTPQFGGGFLLDLVEQQGKDLLGTEHVLRWGNRVGVLLKLLHSDDRLLVQTHPDKAKAKRYFNSNFGKTEAWYVLDTNKEKKAVIYAGFQPGVTRERWKDLIEKQDTTAILNSLHCFEIKRGDVIFIPAGLPHALGANSLVAEIQEPTDITLRAERFRPDGSELPESSLHAGIGMEGLLDCFCFQAKTREETQADIFLQAKTETPAPNVEEHHLITYNQTPCFAMSTVVMGNNSGYSKNNPSFVIGLVLEGQGNFTCSGQDLPLQKGDEFLIPHMVSDYRYRSKMGLTILECYPPTAFAKENINA